MPHRTHRLSIDGFGGQGVISIGKYLATVAMDAGLHVAFVPSYGAEVRGGTSHCDVIVSRQEVLSPRVSRPDSLLLFCQTSFDKLAATAPAGCNVMINQTLVDASNYSGEAKLLAIPAQELAEQNGNRKAANMVCAGAWMALTGLFDLTTAQETVRHISPPKLRPFIDANIAALTSGWDYATEHWETATPPAHTQI